MENEIILQVDGVDVTHQLDADGNAVIDGVVKFTKEEIEALQTPPSEPIVEPATEPVDDEDVTFDTIVQATGINILNQDGTPRTYDMTTEGFSTWGKDLHATGFREGQQTALESLFKDNPDIYDMYKYKQERGSLEGYVSRPNLDNIAIDDSTPEDALWDVIYEAEIAQGKSKERAKKIADFSKANESLKEDAADSLEILKKIERSKNEARNAAAQEAARKEQEVEERYFGVTYDEKGKEIVLNIEGSMYDMVVNKGAIGDLFIPATGIKVKGSDGKEKQLSRKAIFDYMSKPVKEINGVLYSQAQIDDFARMSNLQSATKQFLLNLAGTDVTKTLLNRAATSKAVKIIKANATPGGKVTPPTSPASGGKVVLPV